VLLTYAPGGADLAAQIELLWTACVCNAVIEPGKQFKSIFGVSPEHVARVPVAVQKLNPMSNAFYDHEHIKQYNVGFDDMVTYILDKVRNNIPERDRVLLANLAPLTAHGVVLNGSVAAEYYAKHNVHDDKLTNKVFDTMFDEHAQRMVETSPFAFSKKNKQGPMQAIKKRVLQYFTADGITKHFPGLRARIIGDIKERVESLAALKAPAADTASARDATASTADTHKAAAAAVASMLATAKDDVEAARAAATASTTSMPTTSSTTSTTSATTASTTSTSGDTVLNRNKRARRH